MKKSAPRLSIKIITLFPQFIYEFAASFGIIQKAIASKLLSLTPVDLRTYGLGNRQTVDDRPYGGGVGMLLRPDVMFRAIRESLKGGKKEKTRVILLCPQGRKFDQSQARRLAGYDRLILVAGRYEGFDERIRKFVDEELSIGDYVLMGGELPALVVSEAVMRLRPGILGKDESSVGESFGQLPGMNAENIRPGKQYLEYPQYTKPDTWKVPSGRLKGKTLSVPGVLLTGHHANISHFRVTESEKRTKKRRPDL